jgi:hypothetical protein
MTWKPSRRQLEVLADCMCAGLDTTRTARQLGVDEAEFVAWAKRMAAGIAEVKRREAALQADADEKLMHEMLRLLETYRGAVGTKSRPRRC